MHLGTGASALHGRVHTYTVSSNVHGYVLFYKDNIRSNACYCAVLHFQNIRDMQRSLSRVSRTDCNAGTFADTRTTTLRVSAFKRSNVSLGRRRGEFDVGDTSVISRAQCQCRGRNWCKLDVIFHMMCSCQTAIFSKPFAIVHRLLSSVFVIRLKTFEHSGHAYCHQHSQKSTVT